MRVWIALFALFFCGVAIAAPLQDHSIDPEALSRLAASLEIPPGAHLIEETQKRWLRKSGQERWEISEISEREFVLQWAEEVGLFAPWKPVDHSYDKALVLGATTSCMEQRLAFLGDLWREGTRFDEVVWLTGQRPLDPRVDGLLDVCAHEAEAARVLWERADIPEEMRNLPVVFVAVPMHTDGPVPRRPNTADTIVAWLKQTKPCKALFISDQPFCGYQFAVVKSLLPDAFAFDLAGQGVQNKNHPAAAAIILDSVARWIYQESISPTK